MNTPEDIDAITALRSLRQWLHTKSPDGVEFTAWPERVAELDVAIAALAPTPATSLSTAVTDTCTCETDAGGKSCPVHVYCHGCSEAGGADRPIYHVPPVCGSATTDLVSREAAVQIAESHDERQDFLDQGKIIAAALRALPSISVPTTHPFSQCGYKYCDWPDGELRCNELRTVPIESAAIGDTDAE